LPMRVSMSRSVRCVSRAAVAAALATAAVIGCRSNPAPTPVVSDPTPRQPDAVHAGWVQGPLASSTVPPGELSGLVVDDSTGQPIALAQVSLRAITTAFTDSSGRFRMRAPNGSSSMLVRRIGYGNVSSIVAAHPDSGYLAVFALPRLEVRLCRVTVGRPVRYPGVVVHVLDALTGRPPTGMVTATVRDGTFLDSTSAQAVDSAKHLSLTAAVDRPGKYDVTLKSAGYHDWHGEGATRLVEECGGQFNAAFFRVWLIPE
jgi:hypothetical protein